MIRITLKPKSSACTSMLLTLFAFSLAACDSKPAPTPPPTSATSTANTTANTTGTTAPTQGQSTSAATAALTATMTTAEASPTQAATLTTQSAAASPVTSAIPVTIQATETPVASNEQPVAPEQNPPGDIPDNQVFVEYASAANGYTLQVPEGWARTETGTDVSFVDKLDGLKVAITDAATAPTAKTAPDNEVAALQKSGRAVQITGVKDVQLPGGPAVLVEYTSNSDPNPVTGKQVRLEDNSYLFFKNGKLATLTLWAPLGADNVDQWQQIAKSFKWK
jgi:hypothetical protein